MPGLERLAKLKDYSNTSVIVSNHPYAAAAVMGQRNGRAQLAGPYFRLRTQASSGSDAHAPNVESRSTDVQIDLKRDWADFMKEYARSTKVGFNASASFADMTVQYLNTVRRLPAPRTRTVHESREVEIPPAHGADYAALKELIQTGVNLRPYLARNLQDENKVPRPDKLLSAWGIHHLHVRPGGSDLILLCKITDDAVFMIHAANHFWHRRPRALDKP